EFVLAQVEPPDQKENIQKEIDLQIENDSFAYAINQNQPVVLRSSVYGQSLILHVLATKKRVRGMFAGVLAPGARKLNETVLYPLSIILQNTANALEGAALYQMISEQNKNLEEIVRQRTKALEEQTRELKEEIAYRRLAEESLMVAKEEAEAAARVKSEFIANISHEFRTPLNGILGYAEILLYEARQLSRPDLINDLKAIESAGRHLLGLINDTLDLSKIQAGKMDLHFESFRVVDLIEDVMKTIRPLARKNENQLEVTCQGQVQSMISDKVRVRQVLLNLLSNACKFTEKGTVHLKISVRTVDGSDWIYFMVSDTGIGISPDKVDTLFQEFCQAETGPRKYGGTGLGLAISQRLCHMLGGDISVSSEVGRGSIFTISLPADASQAEISRGAGKTELAGPRISPLKVKNMVTRPSLDEEPEPEPELEPASPETSPKTPGTDRPKVLVIDDDPIVRDLVWRILEKEGWGVETAAQGEEGLRRAREFQPDLITLDVMMPEMDGWTVLRKLKEDPHLASIPVLMLTLVEEKDKALELGASAFLSKPLQWQVFVETVQQFWKKPDAGPPPAEVVPPILVVEDDLTNRDALCRLLRKEGWNVEEARDGQEALEI
ncbi:MAG: response regulator, partial [Nitrospinaceae bacterium]|nr:response regulator [Nitrospinaceae bacterium]NIR57992.1 response regulator [Nitrospinaceae bacterium]NIS88454.1 response regulator [Nitrospinaceae bacterium]NIT85334.1 response regulator [Nitrospinaceae bacterium]NIU47485.1 response regulator [Nitrospinaceae bacterium]